MGYYIGQDGYYEGDKRNASDREVPQRPDWRYVWKGKSGWKLDKDLSIEEIKREISRTDGPFIRLTDDILDLLLKKKIITADELPAHAMKKYEDRAKLRKKLK